MSSPFSRNERVVDRFIRFSRRRRRLVLSAAALAALAAAVPVSRLAIETNVLELLPQGGPALRHLKLYLEHFGSLDRVYVLFEAPPGEDITDHEALVDHYIKALRSAPEVSRVDSGLFEVGHDWSYVFDRALLLVPDDRWDEAVHRLSPQGMVEQLRRAREALTLPSGRVKTLIQADPLGLTELVRERLRGAATGFAFDPTQEGYVSRDGRARLVIAEPTEPPFNASFNRRLFERLEEAEARARASSDGGSGVTIQTAGGYRVAFEAERLIRRELMVNAFASLGLILALVLLVLRSPWILLYVSLPLALGVLMALAILGLTGEKLLAAATGGAAMLFGLGEDGILLMYLRYLEERRQSASTERLHRSLVETGASVVVGNVTTAATFLALLLVDFPSLEELGRLVGLGVLLCCALTLLLLPALLDLLPPSALGRGIELPWLGTFVVRHRRSVLVLGAVLTLGLGFASLRLRIDTRLERLEARTEGTEIEKRLAERFFVPADVLLVMASGLDLEELLTRHRRLLDALGPLKDEAQASSPLALLPSRAEQERAAQAIRDARLHPLVLARQLKAAAEQLGFRPEAFAGFAGRLPRLVDPEARLTYDGLLEHGLGQSVGRLIARRGDEFLTVTYLYPGEGASRAEIERAVAHAGPGLTLTGVGLVDEELSGSFLQKLLFAVGLGTLAVAALIYYDFRSTRLTLLAMLPLGLGLVWSAGVLALIGFEIDLFSAFAVVMTIGVGVDYGVHLVRRYSVEGGSSTESVVASTGAAVLLAGATTIIGFGTLMNSSYGPLRSLGLVSSLSIFACLVSSLLVLPALLGEGQPQ